MGNSWLQKVTQTKNHLRSTEQLTNYRMINSIKLISNEIKEKAYKKVILELRDESKLHQRPHIAPIKRPNLPKSTFKSSMLNKIANTGIIAVLRHDSQLDNSDDISAIRRSINRLNHENRHDIDDTADIGTRRPSDRPRLAARFNRQVKACARDLVQYDLSVKQVACV